MQPGRGPADNAAMTTRLAVLFLFVLLTASRADAQFSAEPGAGEQYHVEVTLRLWTPTPELSLATDGLNAAGVGPVDFVQEFGIEKRRFHEYALTSKAGKHKMHYSSIHMSYARDAVIARTLQFGGLTVPVSAPASADIDWRLRRYGYEWDFLSADRGYLGLIANVKNNKLTASVSAVPYGTESTDVNVWVPTIGLGARGYAGRLFSVTGEFGVEVTRFKGFERLKTDWDGHYVDFDIYGTVNLGRNVAVQGGYRSIRVDYTSEGDEANLRMKGLYWGGNLRF